MPPLRILIADDQIPPSGIPLQKFKESLIAKYGQEKKFINQCVFMGEIVKDLKAKGYRVTAVHKYEDAKSEILDKEFDLAIIDLNWFMDDTIPENERGEKGWSLCDLLDKKDGQNKRQTKQIVFSSRFPEEPGLALRAAKEQRMPLFKKATGTVRNSLLAAVEYVEADLAASSTSSSRFDQKSRELGLKAAEVQLADFRRWSHFSLICIGLFAALLLVAGIFVLNGDIGKGAASGIGSLLGGSFSAKLFKHFDSKHAAVDNLRRDFLKKD